MKQLLLAQWTNANQTETNHEPTETKIGICSVRNTAQVQRSPEHC